MPAKIDKRRHYPTPESRKLVETMTGYGIKMDDIAPIIGIERECLAKHYKDELGLGRTKANAKVIESLYNNAINGNVAAQIWWSKARCGWKETVVNEHGGKDGAPIKIALSQADSEL